jgi:hypothetical protein
MTTNADVVRPADGGSSEERWTRWVARGLKHDRKIKDRGMVALATVAVGLALWSTILLLG